MAVPPCLRLADDVFPHVRSEAARRLVGAGWSQSKTAQALGVSQAMVSKYIHQGDAGQTRGLIRRLADELIEGLQDVTVPQGASPWCDTLTATLARPGADEALGDLMDAERLIMEHPPLSVMPQVGLNLAVAVGDAKGPEDVLAYPARIVTAGARLVRPAPPEFGASHHLAHCLLTLRSQWPELNAIANIRGGPDVKKASGAHVELMGDAADRESLFLQAIKEAREPVALVHDPGAVGIEPCLYVAGRSAAEVARQIRSISKKVKP